MITSVDNPRVRAVVALRKSRERRRERVFVAEGVREVTRALDAGLTARAIYFAPELLAWERAGEEAGEEVSQRVLAKMAYRADPEGVIGVFEMPRHELPRTPSLVLVAVRIEKPGNLGAMARSADAAGADALLVADAAADPFNPNAIRASTGAVFTLPILATTLDEVRALPTQLVAAAPAAHTRHTDADLAQPTAVAVGAEDAGLDDRWLAAADVTVSIPMRGRTVDSLNAAGAATVLLFEAVRQRERA